MPKSCSCCSCSCSFRAICNATSSSTSIAYHHNNGKHCIRTRKLHKLSLSVCLSCLDAAVLLTSRPSLYLRCEVLELQLWVYWAKTRHQQREHEIRCFIVFLWAQYLRNTLRQHLQILGSSECWWLLAELCLGIQMWCHNPFIFVLPLQQLFYAVSRKTPRHVRSRYMFENESNMFSFLTVLSKGSRRSLPTVTTSLLCKQKPSASSPHPDKQNHHGFPAISLCDLYGCCK